MVVDCQAMNQWDYSYLCLSNDHRYYIAIYSCMQIGKVEMPSQQK